MTVSTRAAAYALSGNGSGIVIQLKTASGSVAVGSDSEPAIRSENPAVNITAAASPMALPMASRKAVTIPGSTWRSRTLSVSHLVAPSEYAASTISSGTVLAISSPERTMIGMISSVVTRMPPRVEARMPTQTITINAKAP